MSELDYPPGLPPPDPGHYWVNRGIRGWSLEPSPEGEAAAARERLAHRQAHREFEEREQQARELSATVAERADAALRIMPSDADLGYAVAGLSPARAELLRTEKWCTLARSRLAEAEKRAEKHNALIARRDALKGELDALEAEVREQFARYAEYSSSPMDEPDARATDRARLTQLLSSVEWEVSLTVADGLTVAVAERVVQALEGRLPALREKVLIDLVAQAYLDQVQSIAQQLVEPLSVLCSLGVATPTSRMKCEVDVDLAMPIGRPIAVSVQADDAMAAKFRDMLQELKADPLASIDRPRVESGAKRRAWLGRR